MLKLQICYLSPLSRVIYDRAGALLAFYAWWTAERRRRVRPGRRSVLTAHLEAQGLAASRVNQKLSAIRKLAAEASYAGLLNPATQAHPLLEGRQRVKRDQASPGGAHRLWTSPPASGQADVRACPAAARPVVHRRSLWASMASVPRRCPQGLRIDRWAEAGRHQFGPSFHGVTKGDPVTGERLTSQAMLRCVERYARKNGVSVAPHDLRQRTRS
jgi:hypothetical protein